jgi:hypothetical protein
MSVMETSDVLRHQKIRSLTAQHTEKVADAVIGLWEQVATQIISIVGEGGFDSLYARSIFLTRSTFPWLVATSGSPQTDHRFTNLKTSLEGQTPALIREANSLLLITFTDILASLVGEPLTARILDSAWDNDAQDRAGKEFKNE